MEPYREHRGVDVAEAIEGLPSWKSRDVRGAAGASVVEEGDGPGDGGGAVVDVHGHHPRGAAALGQRPVREALDGQGPPRLVHLSILTEAQKEAKKKKKKENHTHRKGR